MELKNSVCVITGVSKGIGLSLAKNMLDKGAVVYGLGRNRPDLQQTNFHFLETNVRSSESVERSVNIILSEQSGIDVLINNAGLGYFGFMEDHTLDQWHEMFETNVNGIFYMSRLIIPGMKRQGSGHIMNIASTAGLEGYPQTSGYCASKFAVKGMSQSMYKELRDFGVKVTCVFPGSVKTDFFRNSAITPHDYMLMPDEVADVMVRCIETSGNFHTVNLEIRPLQPKGPR
ncbi:MAG: SDR family NAD(P)-dependent oxidoreductase [Bacteroidetes bacterium]|nr:SDR family NAD(P)-dependent oxidoreductase [Bacteroidota bacterium]